MPLNKLAPWGALPRTAPAQPGIAAQLAVIGKRSTLEDAVKKGFEALGKSVDQVAVVLQGTPPPSTPGVTNTPSANALLVVSALGSAVDALTDPALGSFAAVDKALGGTPPATSLVGAAQKVLAAHPALRQAFDAQWDKLGGGAKLPALRARRLRQLLALQKQVLLLVP
jgi:hypothetical protein